MAQFLRDIISFLNNKMALIKQLGFEDVPILHVVTVNSANDRLDFITIQEPDLPIWTGDDFKQYMKTHYNIEYDYYIEADPLTGKDKFLFQLGLKPGICNIAAPILKYTIHS